MTSEKERWEIRGEGGGGQWQAEEDNSTHSMILSPACCTASSQGKFSGFCRW